MRTTLDIEDDVLQAAKELAQRDGTTTGHKLSELARRGLSARQGKVEGLISREGVPLLPSRGEVITLEKVRHLMDQEGM